MLLLLPSSGARFRFPAASASYSPGFFPISRGFVGDSLFANVNGFGFEFEIPHTHMLCVKVCTCTPAATRSCISIDTIQFGCWQTKAFILERNSLPLLMAAGLIVAMEAHEICRRIEVFYTMSLLFFFLSYFVWCIPQWLWIMQYAIWFWLDVLCYFLKNGNVWIRTTLVTMGICTAPLELIWIIARFLEKESAWFWRNPLH